jgi:hypothetical protein
MPNGFRLSHLVEAAAEVLDAKVLLVLPEVVVLAAVGVAALLLNLLRIFWTAQLRLLLALAVLAVLRKLPTAIMEMAAAVAERHYSVQS